MDKNTFVVAMNVAGYLEPVIKILVAYNSDEAVGKAVLLVGIENINGVSVIETGNTDHNSLKVIALDIMRSYTDEFGRTHRKIQAIKKVRDLSGMGLKESKALVDEVQREYGL